VADIYEYSIKGIVQALIDLIAASGGGGGGPGATQYNEDSPSTGGEKLTLAGAVRQDTLSSSTSNDGDYGYLKLDTLGRLHANISDSTVTANQGGSWTVAATQSGGWTTAATQSGTWITRNQDGAGNNLVALTSAPVGTERALVVRNIPSGTQTISGIVDAVQNGAWTVAATQSGTWATNINDGSGNALVSLTGAPTTERGLIVRNIPSGVQTVSGSVNASQSGGWTVAATQSGGWTTAATQSGGWSVGQTGAWSVRTQDNAGNGLESLTSSPAGTERGLIVRNIPSGTQTVAGSGNFTVINSGTFAVQSAQSGTWNLRLQDTAGNGITSAARGSERALTTQIVDASGKQVVPLSFNPGTIDVFGTLRTAPQKVQVETVFSRNTPSSLCNVTTAGGGSATSSLGGAVFATSAAVTANAKGVSFLNTFYQGGSEVFAYFTAAFTTPTSAASYQRHGIYDTNNGFFIGYEGTTLRATVRNNAVDTGTAQAAFSEDNLTGAATSKFTRAGTPEAINWTNINVFRIRYGWVSAAPIYFEVLAPDGNWVTFHTVRQPNSSASPSIRNPDLPITIEVSKTASDATNLQVYTGCWAAGITSADELDLISNSRFIGTLPGNVRATGGRLWAISCTNLNASTRYVQLFDSNGAPSGAPLECYPVYGNSGILFLDEAFFTDEGLIFNQGITIGFSTTALTYTAGVGTDCILVARISS